MKKIVCMFLSIAFLLGLGCNVLAVEFPPTIIEPTGVVYPERDIYDPTGFFESGDFACTSSGGDSLRYWFKNTGNELCTVTLYKKTILGYAFASSMTVSPSDPGGKSEILRNCGTKTYKIKITSQYGGTIRGTLKVAQRNVSEM